jgi:hypothetical protein
MEDRMYRIISAILLALSPACAFAAGEAAIEKEFTLKASAADVVKWVKENPDAVAKSTHSEVVSRTGDTTRVKRETLKGTYEFTMREATTAADRSYEYNAILIEAHQGGIESNTVRVKIAEGADGGATVYVYMFVKISERAVNSFDVRAGVAKSVRGFQNLMEEKFND